MGNTCASAHPEASASQKPQNTKENLGTTESASETVVKEPSTVTKTSTVPVKENPALEKHVAEPTKVPQSTTNATQPQVQASAPSVAGNPTVKFSLDASCDAQDVRVCGSFNNWKGENDAIWKLERNESGLFELSTTSIHPGRYHYKFKVDGKWVEDKTASVSEDDGFGGKNAVLVVSLPDDKLTVA